MCCWRIGRVRGFAWFCSTKYGYCAAVCARDRSPEGRGQFTRCPFKNVLIAGGAAVPAERFARNGQWMITRCAVLLQPAPGGLTVF